MGEEPHRLAPKLTTVRLTATGRGVAVFAVAGLFISWGMGGVAALPASLAVALVLAAPLATWLQTRGVRVLPPPATTAFVGESFPLDVPVVNTSRLFAARDVVLRHGGSQPGTERAAGFVPSLRPGEGVVADTTHRLLARGRHHEQHMALVSTFPFGLARCRVAFDVPVDVLVLPRLGSLRNLDRITAHRHGLLFQGPTDRGDEQEFHGMREWRDGESLRRVHWKLSARRGRLLVREFRGEDRPPLHVVLERRVPGRRSPKARGRSFERAVSLAATIVEHYLRRQHIVRLSVTGRDEAGVERRRGRGALFPVLTRLADAQPVLDAAASIGSGEVAGAEPDGAARGVDRVPDRRRDEITVVVRAGGRAWEGTDGEAAAPGDVLLDVDRPSIDAIFTRTRPVGHGPLLGLGR